MEITGCTGTLSGQWDRPRISQVLSNLINNAVQHGVENGAVKVTLRGGSNEVVISVHNCGPVLSDAAIRQIFEPLKRSTLGTSDEEATAGLGLGLYIAQQIVQARGGSISVESSENLGTTFTVRLPR